MTSKVLLLGAAMAMALLAPLCHAEDTAAAGALRVHSIFSSNMVM